MKRRVLTVMLAVLLALVGTGGVLIYVHQANTRAVAGQKAVTVLVAGGLISAGTSAGTALQGGLLTSQTLPASSVPTDAVRSLTPGLSSLVMSADLQPGQLLLRPMLVAPAQVTGALAIPSGMIAVSIMLCVPEATAGYVHAGSQVAVFDTFVRGAKGQLTAGAGCQGQHTQQDFGTAHTRMVVPKAEVISVGTAAANAQASTQSGSQNSGVLNQNNSGTSNTSGQSTVLVTLAVSQTDAERLILVSQTGLPYLALLSGSSRTGLDATLAPLFKP